MSRILFLDIETVSSHAVYSDMDERWRHLWDQKCRSFQREQLDKTTSEWYQSKAAIFSEFGKIVCISLGFFSGTQFRVRSFASHSENEILVQFTELINTHFNDPNQHAFCGHNIREFDIPYLCRRLLVHRLKLPSILDITSKKPWEVKYIYDTLEMWKFGDYKHYISLDLLAACLNLPSSKSTLDGSQVGHFYWILNDLESITRYCQDDVILTTKVYQAFIGNSDIEIKDIQYLD
ncbi:MAG: ribonuclease H-like domain-containing protein [Bacteroidota bacterium]|nr:ribonuclease H-like domain-containing protein [Bacteroidota bacterium]